MVAGPPTGVEVKTAYFPLAFLYALFPVVVVINGTEVPGRWGAQFFPLTPGHYTIGCFTRYLFTQRCGWNTVDIDIYPGQVIRVTWTAPHVTLMKGPIRAELIANAPPQPPWQSLTHVSPPAPLYPPNAATAATSPSKLCGRCYATLEPGAAACPKCGASIG